MPKNNKSKKKNRSCKSSVRHIIHFDLEDMELIDYPWCEDREPPPMVKGRIKKKEMHITNLTEKDNILKKKN